MTPRRTRLLRAADLAGFRTHLADLARAPGGAGHFLLVPTQAAAEQLLDLLRNEAKVLA